MSTIHQTQSAVVGGYQNVEDRFVAAFLAHEGESLAEAKARVRREAKQSAASAGNGRKHS